MHLILTEASNREDRVINAPALSSFLVWHFHGTAFHCVLASLSGEKIPLRNDKILSLKSHRAPEYHDEVQGRQKRFGNTFVKNYLCHVACSYACRGAETQNTSKSVFPQ